MCVNKGRGRNPPDLNASWPFHSQVATYATITIPPRSSNGKRVIRIQKMQLVPTPLYTSLFQSSTGMTSFFSTLGRIEDRFDIDSAMEWLDRNWYFSCINSAIYVLLLYLGTKWMENRKPFNLRRSLVMWNTGLALFSLIALVKTDSYGLVRNAFSQGLEQISCHSKLYQIPNQVLWGTLYTLSKLIELGDTAFIVLRKTPLVFLHWYHHITVMFYTWYCTSLRPAPTHSFMAMNLFVHFVMYSYYAFKAAGVRIPSQLAQAITFLQMLQMVGGMAVNIAAFRVLRRGESCEFSYDSFIIGIIIYTSYLFLFANFFYHRYLVKKKK